MNLYLKSLLILFPAILCLSLPLQAETLDKQKLGLRYTDNAYLTPEEKISDFYLLLSSRFTFRPSNYLLGVRLDLADYSKTHDNDYIGLNLNSRWNQIWRSIDSIFKVFHKNYFQGNVATSDSSFTHTGLGLALEKEWTPKSSLILFTSFEYEVRYFHEFDGRTDHQFMLAADFEFNSSPKFIPYTYADLGFNLSSLAAYSTYFFDVGAGFKGPIKGNLWWLADIDIHSVSYLNRIVDETFAVTKRRGKIQTVNETDNERTSNTSIGGGLRWIIERNYEFESKLVFNNQNSNNPNFAYQNTEIYLSLLYKP